MAQRQLLKDFNLDVVGGVFLGLAALAALCVANSPLAPLYFGWLKSEHTLTVGAFTTTMSMSYWIKDGLMTIFFFAVGLEIKREVVDGELSSLRKLALPVCAALGGMVVPAAIYALINTMPGGILQGWPVPVATDIAFAVAAFAAFGARAPTSLKIFLLTVAVVDDLGAVVLIATVFSSDLNITALVQAAGLTAMMVALGRWRGAPSWAFAVGAVVLWAVVLTSGVHASIAGVAAALTVPARPAREGATSTLNCMHHAVHPWVMWGIMPLFAFAAAGLALGQMRPTDAVSPEALGIALGLVIGKPIGVFGGVWLCVTLGLSPRLSGASWLQILAVAFLCGIGFTMSLFLAALAFADSGHGFETAKLGVMMGSVVAALIGGVLLHRFSRQVPAVSTEGF